MAQPRFIFLSRSIKDEFGETQPGRLTWMIVSSNSRPLGRAPTWFVDYDECRASVIPLQKRSTELRMVISAIRSHWRWIGHLDDAPAVVSTRDYLRQHECEYNVRRFLEAIPLATIPTSVRVVDRGHSRN